MRLYSLGALPIAAVAESPRAHRVCAVVFGPLSLPSLSPTLLSLLVCWWWRDPPCYRPHADAAQNFIGLAERPILKILLRGEVPVRCPEKPILKIRLLGEVPFRCPKERIRQTAGRAARGSATTATAITLAPRKRCLRYRRQDRDGSHRRWIDLWPAPWSPWREVLLAPAARVCPNVVPSQSCNGHQHSHEKMEEAMFWPENELLSDTE
jgi:hypothetical protein